MADSDDAIVYTYENVGAQRPAYWRVGAVEFVVDDDRAAYAYVYENVT